MTVEGLYIAAPSKHKEEAYEFVKYVTDLPAAKIMALEGRQTPANAAVYEDPQVKADAQLASFREQVAVAIPMPELAPVTNTARCALSCASTENETRAHTSTPMSRPGFIMLFRNGLLCLFLHTLDGAS